MKKRCRASLYCIKGRYTIYLSAHETNGWSARCFAYGHVALPSYTHHPRIRHSVTLLSQSYKLRPQIRFALLVRFFCTDLHSLPRVVSNALALRFASCSFPFETYNKAKIKAGLRVNSRPLYLLLYCKSAIRQYYSMILATLPEPTVRPP